MRVGRETRSARQRRAHTVRRRRIIILIAVLVAIPLITAVILGRRLHPRPAHRGRRRADIPALEDQAQVSLAETTQIYAADGTLLAYLHGDENRTVISGKQIPDSLKHALVAVEDERFYSHTGVDMEGFFRALVANISAQGVSEGFSTITMQLVGNLYLDRTDISFDRKFNEMALAWQMEKKYSKDEILDMYLNTVYFGSNAYGVEAAARTYFDKDPKDLTLAEAALLAGLPQAPSAYSPRQASRGRPHSPQPDPAQDVRAGLHHRGEELQALDEPLELAPYSPYTKVQEPYVVAYVRKQLIDMYGEDRVFKGGLRVETTINPAYQKLAMEAIATTLNREGRPLGRPGEHRDADRLHQGHGGRQRLRQLQVQPGRPGTPPAGLGLQDLRAHRRHRDGDRPLQHLLRVAAGHAHLPGRPQTLERQDLRQQLLRHLQRGSGHPAQRQHRLRPDGPGRRRRSRSWTWLIAWASPRISTPTRP